MVRTSGDSSDLVDDLDLGHFGEEEDDVFGWGVGVESPRPDFIFEVGEGFEAALEGSCRCMVRWAEVDVGSIRMV